MKKKYPTLYEQNNLMRENTGVKKKEFDPKNIEKSLNLSEKRNKEAIEREEKANRTNADRKSTDKKLLKRRQNVETADHRRVRIEGKPELIVRRRSISNKRKLTKIPNGLEVKKIYFPLFYVCLLINYDIYIKRAMT